MRKDFYRLTDALSKLKYISYSFFNLKDNASLNECFINYRIIINEILQ